MIVIRGSVYRALLEQIYIFGQHSVVNRTLSPSFYRNKLLKGLDGHVRSSSYCRVTVLKAGSSLLLSSKCTLVEQPPVVPELLNSSLLVSGQ